MRGYMNTGPRSSAMQNARSGVRGGGARGGVGIGSAARGGGGGTSGS